MTYLWLPALPITVVLDGERIVQLQWDGRNHRVIYIAQHWRVDVEWWRQRIWRDYYKVVTDTGLLVVIYCDLLDCEWYLQQVYD